LGPVEEVIHPQPVGLQDVYYAGGPYSCGPTASSRRGPQSVVLSFDRFDTTTFSAEIIADVDNCRLFKCKDPA
jgi:hypothetical protein